MKKSNVLLWALICLFATNISYAQRNKYDPEVDQLTNQLSQDLVAAGFSIAATVSGSVPLALTAGFLTKYVVTYGIGGVKALINHIKGDDLQDLGHINLYSIYLLHIKRNLYKAILDIRTSALKSATQTHYIKELEKVEKYFAENCPDSKCKDATVDQALVDMNMLSIALDGKKTIDLDNFLSLEQLKASYFYLNNLFLDIMIAEQRLAQSQVQVLSNQINEIKKELHENKYISLEEKEYRFQKALNISLRWKKNMAQRTVAMNKLLLPKLKSLQNQNDNLEKDIQGYNQ